MVAHRWENHLARKIGLDQACYKFQHIELRREGERDGRGGREGMVEKREGDVKGRTGERDGGEKERKRSWDSDS